MGDGMILGQYYAGNSLLHKADARTKLLAVILFIVMLFSVSNMIGLGVGYVLIVLGYVVARIPLKLVVKGLRPILPLILFTSILNLFFMQGDVVWSFWIIKISRQGIELAVAMSLRLIALVSGTSLLTYTTTPMALTDAIERLLKPFAKIGLPVHELAMMMTIALRFIPTLVEETGKIMNAQKARGADLETGGMMQRAKAFLPILIPLFVSAFNRAMELALAMECRCYHGGEGRTKMTQTTMGARDVLVLLVMVVAQAAVIYINRYGPVVL